jgi:D-alanine-D-alanine ligase
VRGSHRDDALKILILHDSCLSGRGESPSVAERPDLEVPAAAMEEALRSRGHGVIVRPFDAEVARFADALDAIEPDVVLNLCEGVGGQAGFEVHVCALLELLGVPFTGSGPVTLALCLDKERAKAILAARELPTPRHRVFGIEGAIDDSGLRYPLIVKPIGEDASVGIEFDGVVADRCSLERRVAAVAGRFGGRALVEEFVDGRELNVAILPGAGGLDVLPIAEIDFSAYRDGWPRILSYEAKWSVSSEAYRKSVPVCPAPLSPDVAARVREVALRSFEAMGCTGYARVDLRLDARSNPFVLEVNPNPDLSPDAGFARAARVAGLGYPDLLLRVIEGALRTTRSSPRRADVAKAVG